MHTRGRGWSGIVDEDEFPEDGEEKTDPNLSLPQQADKGQASKVARAPRGLTDDLALADPPTVLATGARQKAPAPKRPEPPATVTEAETPGGRKLRLPLPGEAANARRAAAEEPREAKPAPPSAPPAAAPTAAPADFSSDQLLAKLEEPRRAAPSPRGSIWQEYREVLRIGIVGLLAIAGAITYRVLSEEPAVGPAGKIGPAGLGGTATATVAPAVKPELKLAPQEPSPPDSTTIKRSANPMLSIMSTPPKAMVEIDGVVYGETPLILPSPRDKEILRVRLLLPNHKKWEQTIRANEAGHFTVHATLAPVR